MFTLAVKTPAEVARNVMPKSCVLPAPNVGDGALLTINCPDPPVTVTVVMAMFVLPKFHTDTKCVWLSFTPYGPKTVLRVRSAAVPLGIDNEPQETWISPTANADSGIIMVHPNMNLRKT